MKGAWVRKGAWVKRDNWVGELKVCAKLVRKTPPSIVVLHVIYKLAPLIVSKATNSQQNALENDLAHLKPFSLDLNYQRKY
jgi:hypothetical protein